MPLEIPLEAVGIVGFIEQKIILRRVIFDVIFPENPFGLIAIANFNPTCIN